MENNLTQVNLIIFIENILNYIGLGAISKKDKDQLIYNSFSKPPYQVEVENWNNKLYITLRKGRLSLKKIQGIINHSLEKFLQESPPTPKLYEISSP